MLIIGDYTILGKEVAGLGPFYGEQLNAASNPYLRVSVKLV